LNKNGRASGLCIVCSPVGEERTDVVNSQTIIKSRVVDKDAKMKILVVEI
jgi:hypothetical protein